MDVGDSTVALRTAQAVAHERPSCARMRMSPRAARPLSGQTFMQFEGEAPPGNPRFGSHIETPLVEIEPFWAGQRWRGSHPRGPEIGRSSSTSAMARSPFPYAATKR